MPSSGISCAASGVLFGSFSSVSVDALTANRRGFESPYLPAARTSYCPGGTLAAMLTVNWFATGWGPVSNWPGSRVLGSAVMPGWEKSRRLASSRSLPAIVTSTFSPTRPPAGKMLVMRATGSWPSAGRQMANESPRASSKLADCFPICVVGGKDFESLSMLFRSMLFRLAESVQVVSKVRLRTRGTSAVALCSQKRRTTRRLRRRCGNGCSDHRVVCP